MGLNNEIDGNVRQSRENEYDRNSVNEEKRSKPRIKGKRLKDYGG